MSSARTPRHGAGDALPAPPRRAHPPANTHADTAHTQRLTNTNTRTHTHTRTPHSHTIVHVPADTPPPRPPSPRMLSRTEAPQTRAPRRPPCKCTLVEAPWGRCPPHTPTHELQPLQDPPPPQRCGPEWKQQARGHPHVCPVHTHTAVHNAPSPCTVLPSITRCRPKRRRCATTPMCTSVHVLAHPTLVSAMLPRTNILLECPAASTGRCTAS